VDESEWKSKGAEESTGSGEVGNSRQEAHERS
jgi:hypothetical protein